MSTELAQARSPFLGILGRLQERMKEHFPVSTQYTGNLFHYTTAEGLIGIIRTSKLWATDSQYLNDPGEFRYGANLVESEFERLIKGFSEYVSNTGREVLASIHSDLGGWFVSSFCDEGDVLDQWRSYGDQGVGYCLEFDGPAVQAWARQMGCQLFEVEYDRDRQIEWLDEHIWGALDVLEKDLVEHPNPSPSWRRAAVILLRRVALPIILKSKHPAFSSEGEIRLIYTFGSTGILDDESRVRYKSGRGFVIPYLPLPISGEADGVKEADAKLPILTVRCGPTTHPELGKLGVESLLRRHSYEKADVLISEVPYRG